MPPQVFRESSATTYFIQIMFSGFGSGFFGGNFAPISNKFEDYFRCYPVAMMPDNVRKDDANYGGKIFLPPSALNRLTMLHIRYPMLFELTNEALDVRTHSGVLEFVAEEGRVYIPQWMMETLKLQPGSLVKIANCDLPNGRFVKIEPQSVDFLDISDPKAVLENTLRKFSTLTVDDVIEIDYYDTKYGIKVLEVKPENPNRSICVVETDLETDFAPPVGYVEPEYTPKSIKPSTTPIDPSKVNRSAGAATMAKSIKYADIVAKGNKTQVYQGSGQKLSGKGPAKEEENTISIDDLDANAEPVPLRLPENQIFLGWPVILPAKEETESKQEKTKEFTGEGKSLRQSRKRGNKGAEHHSLKNHSRSPDYIEIDD